MATEVNCNFKEVDGEVVSNELFLVTIALEEYRSLIQENARLNERTQYLEHRIREFENG